MNNIAFIIGIEDYQKVAKLMTPVNDCKKIAAVLREKYDFQTFEKYDLEKDPLKDWIANEIKKNVGENDCVIFYFAGHGIAKDSEEGLNGFICPSDTDVNDDNSLIPMKFLREHFLKLKCRHFLLILDCCFAGSFRMVAKYREIIRTGETLFQQHYRYYTQNPSWQVLTSSSHTQKALDVLGVRDIENNNHSPFAKCLIEGLEGKADSNNDKVITAADLYNHLHKHIPIITGAEGQRQNIGFFPLDSHDNGEFLFLPKGFDPSQLTEIDYTNPYKGLNAYGKDDGLLFLGRDNAIKELLDKVNTNRFVVVVGPSGWGKSSLVKAGIISKLKERKKRVEEMRPNKDPIAELSNIENDFDVLVIDQFEELITQSDTTKAAEFIKILRGYIDENRKTIIITVRLDFESKIEKKEIEDAWKAGRFKIQPFTFDELREVIITPCARVGRFIDDKELVNKIVNDVVDYPSSLPLLSFTMKELFEKCQHDKYRNILFKDYNELGGITGSLQQAANRIVESLTDEEQQTLKNIMLRMVTFSMGTISSKRVILKDLVFGDIAENKRVEKVKKVLTDERLIVPDTDSMNQEFIEPTHDALIREWAKLSEWIEERTQETILLQNKLTDAVKDYESSITKGALWHNDPRLDLLKGSNIWINDRENMFVKSSIKLKKRNRLIRNTSIVVAFIVITSTALYAFKQQKVAEENAIKADAKTKEALDNLKLYKLQEIDKFIIDADTYGKSGHSAYSTSALDSVQKIKDSYFQDSQLLQKRIDSMKLTLK